MPQSLVKARRIRRVGSRASRGFPVYSAGSSRKPRKHSSSSRRVPASPQRPMTARSREGLIVRPVGLLGLQRISRSSPGSIRDRIRSVSTKSSPSGNRLISQPTASSAASYSPKQGAVTSARFGPAAKTARQIRSAAPLPQSTQSFRAG